MASDTLLRGDLFPGLKSEGQYVALDASFEAFRTMVNGIMAQDKSAEAKGKEALDKALETLRMATHLTVQLGETPEAATSPLAEQFKKPPSAFTEQVEQKALLAELNEIQSLPSLGAWWAANRVRIDGVRSPGLRNPLIDAIRDKKHKLEQEA